MRTPSFRKSARGRQTSKEFSLPAPVKGWNDRDAAANMDSLYATILENWFPETNDIRVRKGQDDHVTGVTGQVDSLMVYNKADGTQTLFGANSGNIYDMTSAGAVGAAVVTGQSNGRWNHENFTLSDGTSYLLNFNGVDNPQFWNGTTWTSVTSSSTPGITGVTTTALISVAVHKRRVWLVEKDSMNVWYLPVDSVGGAARKFPLGGIARKGGFIMAIGTWTIDAGEGADDYWVAVTSEGEVIVYKGTDPTSSSTWNLHGVWALGDPIGRRCLLKYRGDLLLITVDGVFPLSRALLSAQTDPAVAITEVISKAMTDASDSSRGNFGWQLIHFPQADMLILNVPLTEGAAQQQYVMNTITEAWAKFKSISANAWAILDTTPYFAGNGKVSKFWGSLADNNTNIDTDMRQAENYFGSKGRLKYFKAMRPIFRANGIPTVSVGINTDYQDTTLTGPLSFSSFTAAIWDNAVWDTGLWGGGLSLLIDWQTVGEIGTSGGVRLQTASLGLEVRYQSSDHLYEYGGVIG